MVIRIIAYAGPSGTDERPSSVVDWSEEGPEEALRRIGLEYKTADYMSQRQVVIVLTPEKDEDPDWEVAKKMVRRAVNQIQETGLLDES